jgi:hypothetical protein
VPLAEGETICKRCRIRREAAADEMRALLPDGIAELGCDGPRAADLIAEMRRVIGEKEYRKLFFRMKRTSRRLYLHGPPTPKSTRVPF